MFFKRANSVEKQPLNFRNASHCFRNWSLSIILNNLGLTNYKRKKRNLEFRTEMKMSVSARLIFRRARSASGQDGGLFCGGKLVLKIIIFDRSLVW